MSNEKFGCKKLGISSKGDLVYILGLEGHPLLWTRSGEQHNWFEQILHQIRTIWRQQLIKKNVWN